MRESNESSRDLWKILEKEFKIYKYARSEHEAGNPPRNKHEATLCSAKEITSSIFKQEDFNNHLIEEAHAFCGIKNLSTASTFSSNTLCWIPRLSHSVQGNNLEHSY